MDASDEQAIAMRCERVRNKLAYLTLDCHYFFEVAEALGEGYASSERTNPRRPVAPPLAEMEVQQLEGRYGIQLPAEYRMFLKHVTSGGVGPSYGLLEPDSWTDHLWLDRDVVKMALSRPCVLLKDRDLEVSGQSAAVQPGGDWFEHLPGFDIEAFTADQWSPYFGTACVCYTGCSGFTALILNGQYSGRLFEMDAEHWPISLWDGGFLDWYEGWVDRSLKRKRQRR